MLLSLFSEGFSVVLPWTFVDHFSICILLLLHVLYLCFILIIYFYLLFCVLFSLSFSIDCSLFTISVKFLYFFNYCLLVLVLYSHFYVSFLFYDFSWVLVPISTIALYYFCCFHLILPVFYFVIFSYFCAFLHLLLLLLLYLRVLPVLLLLLRSLLLLLLLLCCFHLATYHCPLCINRYKTWYRSLYWHTKLWKESFSLIQPLKYLICRYRIVSY